MKEEMRKITLNLPAKLLDDTLRASGKGLTETLRDIMEKERHARACDALLKLRGRVDFGMSWQDMKATNEERDLRQFTGNPVQ